MKVAFYILLILILCSCKNKPTNQKTDSVIAVTAKDTLNLKNTDIRFNPYQLNKDYTVIDTGSYTNDGPMTGGSYAIIKSNGIVVDTIDLYYGMKSFGNQTYLYQKLEHESDPTLKDTKRNLILNAANYLLIINNKKTQLDSVISSFNDYFSSPNVINEKIYFWQLEKIDTNGRLKVSAAVFDLLTRKTKSYFLLNDLPETDDNNYFSMPFLEKDHIVFNMDDKKKWNFSTDLNPN